MATNGGGGSGGFPNASALLEEYKKQIRSSAVKLTSKDPVVPLWKTRPRQAHQSPQAAAKAAEFEAVGVGAGPAPTIDYSKQMVPKDSAAASFLDMSPQDMEQFRRKASTIGLIKPDATTAELYNAWQNMVSAATEYNLSKKSPGKYISPWEAVDRLAMDRAGRADAALDLFGSQTSTQVQQYSPEQLAATAKSVLQQELGRDPTDAELQAYTIAVNQAAKASPVTQVTHYDKSDPNNVKSSTSQSGGIDPQQVILDQIRNSQEEDNYQSATLYYQSALNALNSIV